MTSAVSSSTTRSPRLRRRGLTAVLAGALLAGSTALAVTAAPAGATDDDDYGPPPSYTNLITLKTGESNAFTYYPPETTTPPTVQALASTSRNCAIKTPVGSVVALSASSVPGLRSGSIGAVDKTSGESCGQVNSGLTPESLTIELLGRTSDLAVLDLELQKNAVVLATAYLGSTVAGNFELQSGPSVPPGGTPPSRPDAKVATCLVSNSSGPNSYTSDNCRWVIEGAVFDRIVLTAIAGQFSLEGGADGTVTRRTAPEPAGYPAKLSYFRIVVLCTPENSTVSGTGVAGDGSSFKRSIDNADGSTCVALPTTLTRDADGDLELAKAPGQPFHQGVLTAEWLATPGTDLAINKTEVNFWADKRETGWVTIPWCPTSLLKADGTVEWLTGIDSSTPGAAATDLDGRGLADQDQRTTALENDNGLYQYGCVLSRTTRYNGTSFETVEELYLLGDIFIRR